VKDLREASDEDFLSSLADGPGGRPLRFGPPKRLTEMEANAFASALLMPEDAVRDAVTKLRSSTAANPSRVVEVLAAEFDVSTDTMGYRLINLGLSS
jgi:Zn-dependent peptidase ImmA (M78 family)